ncbi:hypothetical protein [Nonomuraea sp. NPDC049480]|uniref:hypothetical protein n=1 Tax=Nonomuraea sp. NPDC049480 TaxID=3364353 RepID=UPI003797A130
MAEGVLAGLALPDDTVATVPTKIMDYMRRGLPVITTPRGASMVEGVGCGLVVPLDVDAVLNAVLDLKEDAVRRAKLGALGHAEARLQAPLARPRRGLVRQPSRGRVSPRMPWPSEQARDLRLSADAETLLPCDGRAPMLESAT